MGYLNDRPTDQCDIADLEIQRSLDRAIEHIKKSNSLKPKGACYDCGSVIESGLFCDKDCRDEYEWFNSMKR